MFTILHVSDVHFGVTDGRGEQQPIADAIISRVRKESWIPDLCIFTGDLAQRGAAPELERGEAWLTELMAVDDRIRLFIVPGNHDVVRDDAPALVMKASETEDTYYGLRDRIHAKAAHLEAFQRWHQGLKKRLGERLLSDWTDPFGCHATVAVNDRDIHLVGLNTALLSCSDQDENRLVQDIATVNGLLGRRTDEYDCVIAAGHHPLDWLAGWNGDLVRQRLMQERGAHLLLHGHQHLQHGSGVATSRGASLTTLEAGAAYQGSDYPQYFGYYRLNFDRREIDVRTFAFSVNAGEWTLDGANSRTFVATLPPPRGGPRLVSDPAPSPPSGSGEASGLSRSDLIELEARRRIEHATAAELVVKRFLDADDQLRTAIYSSTNRIKTIASIVDKVARRRESTPEYAIEQMPDICGFRLITLFQQSVPEIIERLLTAGAADPRAPLVFRGHPLSGVTIHTSRNESDPLSIVRAVQERVARVCPDCPVEVRSSSTGYSSVHLVLDAWIAGVGGRHETFPVEFQVRSVLEEIWGQLDHLLRYGALRGNVGAAPWQRHLNVLKAHFDACIQHLDLIREISRETPPQPSPPRHSVASISRPEKILARFDALLPEVRKPLEAAFELWKQADASRQFGGDAGLFRKAADAFARLFESDVPRIADAGQRAELGSIARMEQAYLLMSTDDESDLEQAQAIYRAVLEEAPNDIGAMFRLGQLLRVRKEYEESREFLTAAIELVEAIPPGERTAENDFVYDRARLNLANLYFREFTVLAKSDEAARLDAIHRAMECARKVREINSSSIVGRSALNDLLYYAWEERQLLGPESRRSMLSDETLRALCGELDAILQANPARSYEHDDTLARLHLMLGDAPAAVEAAVRVRNWLEMAAARRSGGAVDLADAGPNYQWSLRVMQWLDETDECDALAFALDVIAKYGEAPQESGKV